jgi:transcription initiation factor IIE alpha subunit
MTDVDSDEIEFQCPSCGNDLKQSMAQLKVERHCDAAEPARQLVNAEL